jgi:hypothetical protein
MWWPTTVHFFSFSLSANPFRRNRFSTKKYDGSSSQESGVSSSFDSLELRGRSVRFAERVEDHIVHAPGRKSKRLQEKEWNIGMEMTRFNRNRLRSTYLLASSLFYFEKCTVAAFTGRSRKKPSASGWIQNRINEPKSTNETRNV